METLNSKSHSQPTNAEPYLTLHENLNEAIGKIGIHQINKMVRAFMNNCSIEVNETRKFKLIATYIIGRAIYVFDLKEDQFYTSKIPEYREARMACYHLLRKYTDCSYAKIGEPFDQRKRNVLYFCQKCKDMLSIPHYYEVFTYRYKSLEEHVIHFISKLS